MEESFPPPAPPAPRLSSKTTDSAVSGFPSASVGYRHRNDRHSNRDKDKDARRRRVRRDSSSSEDCRSRSGGSRHRRRRSSGSESDPRSKRSSKDKSRHRKDEDRHANREAKRSDDSSSARKRSRRDDRKRRRSRSRTRDGTKNHKPPARSKSRSPKREKYQSKDYSDNSTDSDQTPEKTEAPRPTPQRKKTAKPHKHHSARYDDYSNCDYLMMQPPVVTSFKNDGSFLEMFKKMQESQSAEEKAPEPEPAKALPFVGKRRGGRVLKTGIVEKLKTEEEPSEDSPKDAWSVYMKEVKKYREAKCQEDVKTRPLVK